ncbi:hypothetical protein EGH23_19440 [Halomicroarcula sp. F27]|uniref:Uncharacterized protein n=1 Tax=Haloarcula nitratireducens TaxID=2487749 RepID=A0AAW4PHY9_9EURY|nr:hypothetical protein [Halomicroarcula nitratireducens]MBX0297055.1 hypothetical protein [Halomicroarcula nitratireducens]
MVYEVNCDRDRVFFDEASDFLLVAFGNDGQNQLNLVGFDLRPEFRPVVFSSDRVLMDPLFRDVGCL